MTKKLIALVSTEGKSEEQLFQEVQGALVKYDQVKEQAYQQKKQEEEWEVLVRLPQDADEPPKESKE